MSNGTAGTSQPVVYGGINLEPPHSDRDCACLFCGMFRASHLVRRAVISTLAVPLVLVIIADVDRQNIDSEGAVLGGLYLVATAWTVIAATTWWQPLRRLAHRLRPRSHTWPPPIPTTPP